LDLRVILSLQMLSLNSASFPEKKRVEGDKTSNSSHEASQRMKLDMGRSNESKHNQYHSNTETSLKQEVCVLFVG
jgi:hypothetical protein